MKMDILFRLKRLLYIHVIYKYTEKYIDAWKYHRVEHRISLVKYHTQYWK